jgi:hypothetical protein
MFHAILQLVDASTLREFHAILQLVDASTLREFHAILQLVDASTLRERDEPSVFGLRLCSSVIHHVPPIDEHPRPPIDVERELEIAVLLPRDQERLQLERPPLSKSLRRRVCEEHLGFVDHLLLYWGLDQGEGIVLVRIPRRVEAWLSLCGNDIHLQRREGLDS